MRARRRLVEAAGLTFAVVDHGDEANGDVMLLLHGGTETSAIWEPYLGALCHGGWRVLAPDTRGHGGSPDPAGSALAYDLLAGDMVALLDAVGVSSAVVVGFSDGANIAFEMARLAPDRVRGVVLHGLASRGPTPSYRGAIESFFRAPFDSPADVDGIGRSSYGRQLAEWHRAQGPEGWRRVLELVEPLFKAPPTLSDASFAAVQCPALVVTGDRDPFMPLDEHVAAAAMLPDGELAVWPGVGHGFPARPALVTDLVLDFADRRCRPAPS